MRYCNSEANLFIYVDITIQFALHGDIYNVTFVLYLCNPQFGLANYNGCSILFKLWKGENDIVLS